MERVSLLDQPLVCVDIETDGVSYHRGHVLEVAAIRIEHGEIVDEFSTLINPGVAVPYFITNLTGITTHDIQGQPAFDDVAERLLEIMDGAIFIAHNVRFDYSFLKEEFRRIGITFSPKMFCTVKLSRALYPEVKGHKLSQLIERHGFSYSARHRAYDDAHVLWQFLQLATNTFDSNVLDLAVKKQLALPSLPKNLSEATVRSLPHSPGVYVFKDENDMPLYVGKSIDIKKRVMSHFTRDTAEFKEFKMAQNVHDITYVETGGELSALLLESQMIKEMKPLYNRKLRRSKQFITAKVIANDAGYSQLEFRQLSDISPKHFDEIMGVYQNKTKAKAAVLANIRTFDLCPKLCGIEKANGACFSYQLGRCKGACIAKEPTARYNARVKLAFERTKVEQWPYEGAVLVSEAAHGDTGLVVDEWRIIGRYAQRNGAITTDTYEGVFDVDAYKILKAFMLKPDSTLVIRAFSGEPLVNS